MIGRFIPPRFTASLAAKAGGLICLPVLRLPRHAAIDPPP